MTTHLPFRHSHIFELLAAGFGFRSSAALRADHVIARFHQALEPNPNDLVLLQSRLVALGYREVADAAGRVLLDIIREHRLGTAEITQIPGMLNRHDSMVANNAWDIDGEEWEEEEDEDESNEVLNLTLDLDEAQLLMGGLEAAAVRGNACAHFALACLYASDDDSKDEGSAYWYSRLKQGHPLQGVELEWALAYEHEQKLAELRGFHLAEAAKLGHLATARFEKPHGGQSFDERRQSCLEAAGRGNVVAMRALIEEYDPDNTKRNWVWIYLSELLGNDLRESDMRAYHDGGLYANEEYDDDQGGPMYVAGHEGVELEPLNPEDDAEAQRLAGEYFSVITHKMTAHGSKK
ncbi:hypothetical protein D3C81_1009770 [compost metagenome]